MVSHLSLHWLTKILQNLLDRTRFPKSLVCPFWTKFLFCMNNLKTCPTTSTGNSFQLRSLAELTCAWFSHNHMSGLPAARDGSYNKQAYQGQSCRWFSTRALSSAQCKSLPTPGLPLIHQYYNFSSKGEQFFCKLFRKNAWPFNISI